MIIIMIYRHQTFRIYIMLHKKDFFGLAGLSLLEKLPKSYRTIDPVYALPIDVVLRCGLSAQISRKVGDEVDERLKHYNVLTIERTK